MFIGSRKLNFHLEKWNYPNSALLTFILIFLSETVYSVVMSAQLEAKLGGYKVYVQTDTSWA